MDFNRNEFNELRAAINTALAEVGNDFEINLKIGAITYDPHTKTFRTQLSGESGNSAEIKWHTHCHKYNLNSEWFGKTVTIKGDEYRIAGLNTRAKKSPVEIERLYDNAKYKANANYIKRLMS